MEIIYNGKEKIDFKAVPVGKVFSWCDKIYMKTHELVSSNTGEVYSAINMSTGEEAPFYDNTEVTLVKAQIIVY